MVPSFNDIKLGDQIGPVDKVATDRAVRDFCEVWGQPTDSRFTDDEIARSTGLRSAMVPGVMNMAYMAQVLSHWSGGGVVKRLEVVFRQVVFHNEPLRIIGVVTDKELVQDEKQVECDIRLENIEGELLIGGNATLVMSS